MKLKMVGLARAENFLRYNYRGGHQVVRFTVQSLRVETVDQIPDRSWRCDVLTYRIVLYEIMLSVNHKSTHGDSWRESKLCVTWLDSIVWVTWHKGFWDLINCFHTKRLHSETVNHKSTHGDSWRESKLCVTWLDSIVWVTWHKGFWDLINCFHTKRLHSET